ncbi:MAG: tetratricopeptide repeat protein [Bacteroidaceae bacterium]
MQKSFALRVGMLVVCLVCFFTIPAHVCAQRSPRFDYFFLEASKCMRAGEPAAATELFRHCLEIDSTAAEALYSVALVEMYLLDKDSVGLQMLEEACRRDSANTLYLNVLARTYLEMRDTEKVIPVLERLSSLQKNRYDILKQLVAVYRSTGDNEKAIGTLQRWELKEGLSEEISMQKIGVYGDMNLPDSARSEMQRLCDAFPREMRYRLLLSTMYVEENMPDEARVLIEEVQRREPQYPGLPSAWLLFYQKTDEARYLQVRDSMLLDPATANEMRCLLLNVYAQEATQDSLKIPSLNAVYDTLTARPDCSAEVWLAKARWQSHSKDSLGKVALSMKQVLARQPDNDVAMRFLMSYYMSEKDEEGLEDVCRRGVGYRPDELVYPFLLSELLVHKDQEAEATTILEHGLQVRNENSADEGVSDAFALLGDLYHTQDRMTEAFAAYDSALVYNKNNIACLNNYAYFLSLKGEQLDRAEEMSYRTVVLEPRNVIYLDTYAWILFVKGKFTEARIYMNRAVDPELSDDRLLENAVINGNILEHAGDIHACCGDMELALRFWQMAVARDDGTCSKRITMKIKKRKYLQ